MTLLDGKLQARTAADTQRELMTEYLILICSGVDHKEPVAKMKVMLVTNEYPSPKMKLTINSSVQSC